MYESVYVSDILCDVGRCNFNLCFVSYPEDDVMIDLLQTLLDVFGMLADIILSMLTQLHDMATYAWETVGLYFSTVVWLPAFLVPFAMIGITLILIHGILKLIHG